MNEPKQISDPFSFEQLWRNYMTLRELRESMSLTSNELQEIEMSFVCDALFFIARKFNQETIEHLLREIR